PVYPRWRGEHNACVATPSRIIGLSPLARGTLHFLPGGFHKSSVYPRWRGEHGSAGRFI
ncbi:hypothetical protein SEEM9199_03548, partial [Salmonella enterica subsp. enterica serovar Montevideo str. IA_2009159199]